MLVARKRFGHWSGLVTETQRKLPTSPQFSMGSTDVLMSSSLDPVGKGIQSLMCQTRLAKLWKMLVVTLRATDHHILVAPTELVGQGNRQEQLVGVCSSWLNTTAVAVAVSFAS